MPNPLTISPQPHGKRWFHPPAAPGHLDLGPGGRVVYASDRAGPGAKERLVRRLLASLDDQETDRGTRPDERWPVTLKKTSLGRPLLMRGGQPGPAVSFSQAAGRLWAALAPGGRVGVDVALPEEFEKTYPWARAFRAAELDWARPLCHGDPARAAALLWALKEAAVKALGVGFHFLAPLEVEAFSPRPWQEGWRVAVQAGGVLPVWARPQGGGWLAIARMDA